MSLATPEAFARDPGLVVSFVLLFLAPCVFLLWS